MRRLALPAAGLFCRGDELGAQNLLKIKNYQS
jgi:hypothetical protein